MRIRPLLLLLTLALGLAASAAARAETVAITGATIHTLGPQGTIQNGIVVIENGRIRAVGPSAAVPAGARRIDARGKIVTPGLFDSYSQIGLVEVSAVEDTVENRSDDDRITAAFRTADAVNPRSMLIPVNRIEGLTHVVAAPDAGRGLISGQGAVIDLGGPGDYILRAPAGMFVALGEAGARRAGQSRADALLRLREAFRDALDYVANRKAYDQGNRREYSLSRLDLEALAPVARGEMPLVVAVDSASDIEAVLRLGRELKLKLILAGVAEGWKVAPQIAAAKVPVLVNPLQDLPTAFENLDATLENAARLRKDGVTVAFMTGDAHNSRNIRQLAGNAVAYGFPWDDALAAITSVPAHIWGIADRFGTLEEGKVADLVIWDGDPLELDSFPTAVFIRGRQVPMTSRQIELRNRYRDLKNPLPPAYRRP